MIGSQPLWGKSLNVYGPYRIIQAGKGELVMEREIDTESITWEKKDVGVWKFIVVVWCRSRVCTLTWEGLLLLRFLLYLLLIFRNANTSDF